MTRTHIRHHVGDPVRRPDDKAIGNVTAQLEGNHVVVRWPDQTYSRHHARELVGVCRAAA